MGTVREGRRGGEKKEREWRNINSSIKAIKIKLIKKSHKAKELSGMCIEG